MISEPRIASASVAPAGGRPASPATPYSAPRWLPGPHAQTIWPAVFAPRQRVAYDRKRWQTPDGDFVDVDFARPAAPAECSPLVVLFHGLEGSSSSHYARTTAAEATRRGWRAAVAHFRGCSGEMNIAPRAYHSGDSDEIDWMLRRFAHENAPQTPLFVVGVSLGANALLKWLGERGDAAAFVTAVAAVSAPQDLAAGAASLSSGFNRVYTRNFLRTLKVKSIAKLQQYPGLFDRDRMLAARNFHDFDDAVTAPMHGFRGANDYWQRASCKPLLTGVRVPTLVINALNDPFLPAQALASRAQVSAQVRLEYPDEGGHVGFVSGDFPGNLDWLPKQVFSFFCAPPAAGGEPDPASYCADRCRDG